MDLVVSEGSVAEDITLGREAGGGAVAAGDRAVRTLAGRPVPEIDLPQAGELVEIDPELVADLDHPDLVLSLAYVGPDRRRRGLLARVHRWTVSHGRPLTRAAAAAVLAAALVAALIGVSGSPSDPADHSGPRAGGARVRQAGVLVPVGVGALAGHRALGTSSGGPTGLASTDPGSSNGTSGTPNGTDAVTPSAEPTTTAPTTAVEASPTVSAAATPDQLGAEALALVRYPWQSIPGYSIQFLPITDAPSPGIYGNTTFTWGRTGGTSVLYVYPGETVQHLAGITAFEIGHEVDASAVEPQGGEAQIEDLLGLHPASWAPTCDCAEQGYLSGWYAAAFSNYWSPGVGDWSTVAPPPSGEELAAMERWLNPSIP